ncbi:MAG: restriction endonuclease [Clostridia bacterium]|jgi:restriction system protein|nr:restriction endonuclease [Clostridia bacterium]
MAIVELTNDEINKYIDELYSCFSNGREFEIFLNSFLTTIGFEEVVTTQYVGDKGIDLTCIKRGFDNNGTDTINYYIQAKRYARSNKVQPKEIRDLKGTTKRDRNGNILNSNYVNVFITTSVFTNGALIEANDNPNMPVITIDGKQLLQYCIEYKIGFNFKPVFSPKDIILLAKNKQAVGTLAEETTDYLVEREITRNDIRAKILVIPRIIKEQLKEVREQYFVVFNGNERKLRIDKSRRYFGGITDLYKTYGLLTNDGIYISKIAKWKIENDRIIIDLCEENNEKKL